MTKEKSYHYFLVCGANMCVNEHETISTVTLNAIITSDTRELGVRSLAKAQQALQANFYQRMEGTEIKVVDVVIASLTHLGFMTPSKFHKEPEGFKIAPAVSDSDNPFADADVASVLPTLQPEEATD